jgi:hypothetical protein
MRLKFAIGALLIAACGANVAFADIDVTEYILFAGSGTLPVAGSFVLDETTDTFSNFTVTWAGDTFDLTDSANNATPGPGGYPPCLGSATGSLATRLFLQGNCDSDGNARTTTEWYGDPLGTETDFGFEVTTFEPGNITYTFQVNADDAGIVNDGVESTGTWTLTDVPEPSSVILLLTVLLAVAFVARKRIAHGPLSPPRR